MLIQFNEIIKKYGKPKGVIHIGAHLMEERKDYLSNGLYNTIWIEANPKIYSNIKDTSKNEIVFNYAISDVNDVPLKLNVTNNGQSSSIFELDLHKKHHPHIFVSEILEVKSKRMDTLIVENGINIDDYDFVNLDIQGAELLAIKGFGEFLNKINYIYTEINTNYLYKNCALINEIDDYLNEYGFVRTETLLTNYEWGDALYIKKTLL